MVGGSKGPRSAAGVCSLLWGKFSETMQRCEDKHQILDFGTSVKRLVLV